MMYLPRAVEKCLSLYDSPASRMDARWQVADNSAKSIITLGRYHEEDRFQTEYWGLVEWCSPLGEDLLPAESARLKVGAT